MKGKLKKNLYQSVILTLDDGAKVTYTGAAQVFPFEMGKKHIVDIVFTEPRPLPDGMTLEPIEPEKKK